MAHSTGYITYVVVACHFASVSELCRTTIARLERTLTLVVEGDKIIVTGDVPYELGGPTLGVLMSEWLVKHGVPLGSITIQKGGVGTFSEARIVSETEEKGEDIVVISSPWYLFQAKPIWQKRAQENGQNIRFISVENTGGLMTWAMYIAIGLLVRVSILFRLEVVLESRLTNSQRSRRNGFRMNGCR